MSGLVFVGMGPHITPRIALDIARASGRTVAGYLDAGADAPPPDPDLPRLGDRRRLDDPKFLRDHDLFITAADPLRRELAGLIASRAGRLATLVHPSAVIASSASVGEGSLISASCVIGIDAAVGRFCTLHSACTVDHDDVLGDWVTIAPGAHLAGWVRCGESAYIGIGAAVIGRIQIGENAVVGAGSVVIRDVPPSMTVAGNPAKALPAKS
jgi:acetyltransferase EpsM